MDMSRYVVAFFLFSFLGWLWESIYCTMQSRHWANRGFLYGPLCPIYGFGGIVGYICYDLVKTGVLTELSWLQMFLLGFVVSMVLEYPTSWILETLFHARWWDYSQMPLNIGGRTSVPTSMAFGAGSILVMKYVIPAVDSWIRPWPMLLTEVLSLVLVALIAVDTTLTINSLTDFQKYVASIEEGFQNRMTDIVNQIYTGEPLHFLKTIQRIVVFKLPDHTGKIANQLQKQEFMELMKDYFQSDSYKEMDDYIQHGAKSTLEHCENVAWISYLINKKLRLNADEKELVEAAMLHDLNLYEWKEEDPERTSHGYFDMAESDKTKLRSHMWPINIPSIPKSREALIISFADKYCALIETIRRNSPLGRRRK